ncbi:hypothetical protein Dimus_019630 [Dionaea muscipula]
MVGSKVYAFGGEFTPRVPVDNHLYVFDLNDQSWSVVDAVGDVPPPRIGVTMAAVNETIYVFGGRDATHKELNELYCFDTTTSQWTLLSGGGDDTVTGPSPSPSPSPPHRSYHSVASDHQRYIYIFGGCGVAGRLNDLWAYDVDDRKWIQFPGPGDKLKGRGGAGLAVTTESDHEKKKNKKKKVWVIYGFAGKEVDDVHCFDLVEEEWTEVESTGGNDDDDKPTARSVFSTASIGKYVYIYGGEVDPSDLGHLGAGKFSGDVYALDTHTLLWKKLLLQDQDQDQDQDHPGPRGWCAFSSGERDGLPGLLVYGGNSPSNDRLDDIFFFTPSSLDIAFQ